MFNNSFYQPPQQDFFCLFRQIGEYCSFLATFPVPPHESREAIKSSVARWEDHHGNRYEFFIILYKLSTIDRLMGERDKSIKICIFQKNGRVVDEYKLCYDFAAQKSYAYSDHDSLVRWITFINLHIYVFYLSNLYSAISGSKNLEFSQHAQVFGIGYFEQMYIAQKNVSLAMMDICHLDGGDAGGDVGDYGLDTDLDELGQPIDQTRPIDR